MTLVPSGQGAAWPVAATDAVVVGVTVLATLLLLGLVVAVVHLLRAARQLRREAARLAEEAQRLLGELGQTVQQAGREIERVDRMVGSAEAISEAVGSASRLVGGAVTGPLIKAVALGSGLVRGLRRLRQGVAPLPPPLPEGPPTATGGRRRRGRARRATRDAANRARTKAR